MRVGDTVHDRQHGFGVVDAIGRYGYIVYFPAKDILRAYDDPTPISQMAMEVGDALPCDECVCRYQR